MPARPPTDRICVAQIGAPHGVRGEVRLKAYTADPGAVARYGALQTEDGRSSFEIAALRPAKDELIVRLRGVNDRNAAESLRNVRLYVPRARLPETEDAETFYHADLIGLAVLDRQGASVGTVTGVHNFGAGDLIEIRPHDGGATSLLTFTLAVVPEVNIAGGYIVIDAAATGIGSEPPARCPEVPGRQGRPSLDG